MLRDRSVYLVQGEAPGYVHFAQTDDVLLSGCIRLHNAQGCSGTETSFNDIDTEDDRITFGEAGDDLQTTRPNGLRCSVSSLGFLDLLVVSSKGIEEMINDVGCKSRVSTRFTLASQAIAHL